MTPAIRPMFPHTVDSTMLASFRACPQRFFRQYVQHWKPVNLSVHLVAGAAFAKGLEVARTCFYTQGKNNEDSQAAGMAALLKAYGDFQCPSDSSKSPERMVGALEFYFDRYPLGADLAEPIHAASGKDGIEYSFAEPLSIAHPVTGAPILYTGRSDLLAHRAGGIYAFDEKTTSSLGATWSRQWEMRSQFTGYVWAYRKQGYHANGVVVRGVSILKTKYDTLEVPTYRTDYEVDRWEQQTLRDVARMIQLWHEGYWDYSLDGACTEYGGCPFTRACKSSDPESVISTEFEQRVWDPLAQRELSVAEWEASWGHVRQPEEAPASELKQPPVFDADSLSNELHTMLQAK